MAVYTLPTSTTVSGIIKVIITSDVASLTVPTFDTLLYVGPKVETLSEELGASEISTLEMRIIDDVSTHSQGFWYRILDESTALTIRVQIYENGGYEDFFIGVPSEEETVWSESYIGSPKVRSCAFTLIDVASKLFDTELDTFVDDVYTYASTYFDCEPGVEETSNWKYIIPIKSILGIALKTAGLNTTVEDSIFVFDTSYPDLKFIDGSDNEFDVSEVYLPVAYWDTGATFTHEYWDNDSESGIYNLYGGNFKSFLGDFLFNFGLTVRILYDGTKYIPYLYQRYGRAYDSLITLGSELTSEILLASPNNEINVKVDEKVDASISPWWWSSRGFWSLTGLSDDPPSNMEFDVDRTVLWYAPVLGGGGTYHNTASIGVLESAPYSDIAQAVDFQFFDCISAAYRPVMAATQNSRMQNVISGYHFRALTAQSKTIIRRYSGITATTGGVTSFKNLNILRRAEINDGTTNDTYYINRVTINPNNYTTEIEWLYETSPIV